jgi:hypothetical protein
MKKKTQRKLKKAFKQVTKGKNPPWVTALAAIAGAVVTALQNDGTRGRIREVAADTKERAGKLARETTARADGLVHRKKKAADMPNGMVMADQPGPV